eukprot:CAMPEP_0195283026 /NCGR_PEP_ID=MMETSP0707-20130614/1713_1 /TAXON_ID=33640 /ORGANISM="Asterionellopsis glacialis, Strain CCMP134" /LENGTH=448 /DNA_ID=CAMNT_0040342127 /DNA_START=192 /DNA_END=1535 /DNA_ORIENTATION=+
MTDMTSLLFDGIFHPRRQCLLKISILAVVIGQAFSYGVHESKNAHQLSRLVLGTVALPKVEANCDGGADALLNHAYEKGFTRFDLARTYGLGESERLFGEWHSKSSHVNRDELCLVTKGGMGKDKYGDPNRPLATRESLRSELSASLKALQTDYVDLYMLHRDDLRMDVGIFTEWMNELIEEGKVKRWGVSNWSTERIKEAHIYAAERNMQPPTANSPQLSLAVPTVQVWPSTETLSFSGFTNENMDWHKKNGVEVMGWESLAKGFLAVPNMWNHVTPQDVHLMHKKLEANQYELGTDEWRMARVQRAYCSPENFMRREIAKNIAFRNGLSLAQVSLLYSLSRGKHVSVLVGAELPQHLDEMAALEHLELDVDASEALSNVGIAKPQITKRRPVVNLGNPEFLDFHMDYAKATEIAMKRPGQRQLAYMPIEPLNAEEQHEIESSLPYW